MSDGTSPGRQVVTPAPAALSVASWRRGDVAPCCNRCGFPVTSKPWGCKNPCDNCGTVYPLGDCSD